MIAAGWRSARCFVVTNSLRLRQFNGRFNG